MVMGFVGTFEHCTTLEQCAVCVSSICQDKCEHLSIIMAKAMAKPSWKWKMRKKMSERERERG